MLDSSDDEDDEELREKKKAFFSQEGAEESHIVTVSLQLIILYRFECFCRLSPI